MKRPISYLSKDQIATISGIVNKLEEESDQINRRRTLQDVKIMGHHDRPGDAFIRCDIIDGTGDAPMPRREWICIDRKGNETECEFNDFRDRVRFHSEMFEVEF